MRRLLPALAMLLVFAVSADAQTFTGVVERSLFSDKKAFNEGDIITVIIVEFAEGSNRTDSRTNSDNRMTATASTTDKFTDWLPSFGLDSQLSNRHQAEGQMTTRGSLESKMTAVVNEVQQNGLLVIEGSRLVNVNGDKQTTTLTGVIRPEDVMPNNTVYSYNIGNAQIAYEGSGMVADAGKPGIIARIWNWIF
jgi:flagellar L-ring protein precursor FlgH